VCVFSYIGKGKIGGNDLLNRKVYMAISAPFGTMAVDDCEMSWNPMAVVCDLSTWQPNLGH